MAKIGWLALLGAQLNNPASAGTLRDLIMERRAAREAEAGPANGAFPLPSGASLQRDLAYGDDPAQKIDVYRPASAVNAPVIFMVHGGGWQRGDKSGTRSVRNKVTHWVQLGYVLVSVNYRVLPDTKPVAQADDVAKALAFVQQKAASWGGDPSKVVLMGHSAGAHLVSLISADPSIATRVGAKPWLGTIAIDSAAFDVVQIMQSRHFGLYDRAFGQDTNYWREASPFYRLSGKLAAPMLAVCSSRRSDSCAQARGFADKAQSLGGRVSVMPIEMTHAELNDQLGAPGPYTDDVGRFIHTLGLP